MLKLISTKYITKTTLDCLVSELVIIITIVYLYRNLDNLKLIGSRVNVSVIITIADNFMVFVVMKLTSGSTNVLTTPSYKPYVYIF